jgi:hypothetical protein
MFHEMAMNVNNCIFFSEKSLIKYQLEPSMLAIQFIPHGYSIKNELISGSGIYVCTICAPTIKRTASVT